MDERAVTTNALMLALLGVGVLAVAPGCREDWSADGDGGVHGPCDEMMDAVQSAIDVVCAEFPECSICDYYESVPDGDMPTDEECQEVLESWDHDTMVEMYIMLCEMETGSDGDTDTDIDTDADSDADCDPPGDVTGWGGPCDPEADDCPADTYCTTIDGLDTTIGYCTPLCCEGDHSYCHDIGSGDEQCLVNNSQSGEWWCVVVCTSDDDCVAGTTCQPANASTNICYAADDSPCPDYTGDDPCCLNNNPCDWELNDICDCDSTCEWDAVDCEW